MKNKTGSQTERYPDPTEFDEELYNKLLILPDGKNIDIHFLKKHVDPDVVSFSVPKSKVIRGMQANMFTIELEVGEDRLGRTVLVKRVVPRELPAKPSLDSWREFVASVRTEIQFYTELGEHEENSCVRHLFPRVYYSAGTDPSLDSPSPLETGFVLILEDLTVDHYQTPMMSEEQAGLVMAGLAKLHAHFWHRMDSQERGGFWVLSKRQKLGEVEQAEESWSKFISRFPQLVSEIPGVEKLATKIKEKAEDLDSFVEKGAVTRIHGDAKGWNLFFGKPEADATPMLFIDLQWSGRGHPLQDVAYALTTTLAAEHLHSMDLLVDLYVKKLQEELTAVGHSLPDTLRDEFNLVWLDYARVIMTGLWKNLNPVSLETNRNKVGPSMINRSWEHVLYILKKANKLLS